MQTCIIETISEFKKWRAALRQDQTLGLVPTMGALHSGHGYLIESARRECARLVVSLFVNPLQFAPGEDYATYPRDLESDLAFCTGRGVDILFAPGEQEMYPRPQRTFANVEVLSDGLCGQFRPGHFRGVATVVLKLLNIVGPDRAYFGEKDAQQLALVRRMVMDLNLSVEIVPIPIVRGEDGLAYSSRNQHLTPEQRKVASALYRALQAADRMASVVEDPTQVKEAGLAVLRQEPLIRVEYVEVVDPEEMQPVERISGPVRIVGAIWIGSTRLIDNVLSEGMGKTLRPGENKMRRK
jgi:pantoate--beta-alanine ligase